MQRVDGAGRVDDAAGAATRLTRYFAGELAALDEQPVRLLGTDFQRAVWMALRAIPAGGTMSYSRLAASLGRPMAVRAVAAANGANPAAVFVQNVSSVASRREKSSNLRSSGSCPTLAFR